jgi:hypothetical protein
MLMTSDLTQPPNPEALVTSEQAAVGWFHQHPRTLANWRTLGRGPRYIRAGGRVFYRVRDLEAWLDAHTFEHRAAERAARASRQRAGRTSA